MLLGSDKIIDSNLALAKMQLKTNSRKKHAELIISRKEPPLQTGICFG